MVSPELSGVPGIRVFVGILSIFYGALRLRTDVLFSSKIISLSFIFMGIGFVLYAFIQKRKVGKK